MKKTYAVVGAGFGDEGKGLVTDWLCSEIKKNKEYPTVVRYCGGQQAGHKVMLDDEHHHVFSNFGSGTFREVPTYWSKYCTADPVGIMLEYNILYKEKLLRPILCVDSKCPITTPYDIYSNECDDIIKIHGTCGVGINATYRREEAGYSLLFEDLFFSDVLKIKLDIIREYYKNKMSYYRYKENENILYSDKDNNEVLKNFMLFCNDITKLTHRDTAFFNKNATIVFEGSQGLLLDQNFGFFPHVTPSNTGTKNILKLRDSIDEIYLVTRAYQTRHGNGPMTNMYIPHNIKNNPHEHNIDTGRQGVFRKSLLDVSLIKYGITKDEYLCNNKDKINLVITCLDLIKDEYRFTYEGKINSFSNENNFIFEIQNILEIDNIYLSHSPFGDNIKKFIG